ncbi:hypothetical protein M9H77_06688 [Catharanthus roseus]|uniref:Uncharacterized protein n=1 Tax=Catharanthus roseus TaxID=4058 RepID=A0ACC0BT13_CATRO|nr:hypothetical protein M9H77_06688 [Catharanthus roseus]
MNRNVYLDPWQLIDLNMGFESSDCYVRSLISSKSWKLLEVANDLSDLLSFSVTPPCCERLSLVVFLTIVSGEYLRESRESEEKRDTRDSCLPRLLGPRVPDLNLHIGASTLLSTTVLAIVRPPAEPTRGGGAVSISVSSLSSLRSTTPLLLCDLRSFSATLPCCERLSLVVFVTIVSGKYLRESREGEEERDTRNSCLPRLLGLRVPDLNLHTGASMLLGTAILAVVRPPAEPTRDGGNAVWH